VGPDEPVPIARLLTFLEQGKRMAHDCAKAQAALASDPEESRFLTRQARQEARHALVFRGLVTWLVPKGVGASSCPPALEEYRALLADALRRNDLVETFLAEQVILEGLGKAMLRRIEAGLVKRAAPLRPLRCVLLRQEEAHHGFKYRWLERAMIEGCVSAVGLRRRARDYLALTDQMVLTLSDRCESIDETLVAWAGDVRKCLPWWLVEAPPADRG
jgi:hypothetical protein